MTIEITKSSENPVADFFSSPSNTQETDAKASPHIGFYSCATVPANFARALEQERNEANQKLKIATEQWELCIDLAKKNEQERDEARAAIPDGEWVSYHDYKKVHDAASRLLASINKQLPIGSFTLILPEYYVLKDAIYGKHEAK